MRNIRFDIEDLEVTKKVTTFGKDGEFSDEKTKVNGICKVKHQLSVGGAEITVAILEISANDDSSYGYSVLENTLHEVEFKYLVIFVELFLRMVSNIKVPESGLEFHSKHFTWMSDLFNESFITWYEATKMDLL